MDRRAVLTLLVLLTASTVASAARAQVCYRLPFSNPNLADGWGSTCCGRTNPHRGVDFPQATGTNVPAVADGVVRVITSTGCLGNVLVIQHADGMYSGYCHLSGVSVGVGASVSIGQTIGQVGNTGTCTTGPHLHLTMSASEGGYSSGTTVDPYAYITSHTTCNRAPTGYLDSAACGGITGWAYDPDTADAPIAVHLYLDGMAGAPGAYGYPTRADQHRDDLCAAIGSCAHGFAAPVPLSFFDGEEHAVYAYGIDAMGGANPLLMNTPRALRCDAADLSIPTGAVRRHIPSTDVLAAWQVAVADVAPLTDATLDAIPDGPDLSASPMLVRIDGGDRVFVREHDILRHVASPAVMTAWRFRFEDIALISADDAARTIEGAAWPSTPFAAQGSGPTVYLLDAPPPLWAELVDDDVPAQLEVGRAVDVTFTLRNRGTLTWTDAVALAPTPRDAVSELCDPSWPSCTRAAALSGETLTGSTAEVTLRLRAPSREGERTVCFNLVTDTPARAHWFSDPGENGPEDDVICRTIAIVGEGTLEDDAGSRGDGGSRPDRELAAGCGCRAGGRPSAGWLVSLAAIAVCFALRRRSDRKAALVLIILATGGAALASCGSAEEHTPSPAATPAVAVTAATATAEPATAEPATAEPATAPAEPAASDTAPSGAVENPTPLADAERVLADCLWYADPSVPSAEGPGSMADLDERITTQLGREARVVGRARLAARGCPRLSAGIAVVRSALDTSEEDDEPMTFAITGDDPERAPVVGPRGDERRDGPWQPSEGTGGEAGCNAEAPPDVYLFRARHAASGEVESIVVDPLSVDACGFYGHDLQHGDLDRDGTTELRIETRTGGWYEMSAGSARAQRLWIYDLAEMRPELAVRVGGRDAAEVEGFLEDTTTGSVAFRDVDGDGDRDAIVRRFSEGYRDHPEDTYRDWSTEVHAYDAPTDTYRRAQELDGRAPRGE